MEYLQYSKIESMLRNNPVECFKPYYKWNTFNTLYADNEDYALVVF